jgi:hypothetical protein
MWHSEHGKSFKSIKINFTLQTTTANSKQWELIITSGTWYIVSELQAHEDKQYTPICKI